MAKTKQEAEMSAMLDSIASMFGDLSGTPVGSITTNANGDLSVNFDETLMDPTDDSIPSNVEELVLWRKK